MDGIYKKIVENAKDAIVIIKDGLIYYVNPYAIKELGFSEEEFIGKDFLSFVEDKYRKDVFTNYKKIMSGKSIAPYTIEFCKKNGERVFAEIHSQRITHEGEFMDLAIIRNMEARFKIEKTFEEQEKRFYSLSQNTPDMIARFDEECRYIYANHALTESIGLSLNEIFWKNNKELGVKKEEYSTLKKSVESVFKSKEKTSFYSNSIINNEKKFFHTTLVPEFFPDGSVKTVLAITRDITEIKEIDQIKSDFISTATHQLRSPLSIINWSALVLLKEDLDEEEERDYLEKIQSSTRDLIKITDAFLSTAIFDLEMFTFNHSINDVSKISKEVVSSFTKNIEQKDLQVRENYSSGLKVHFDDKVIRAILKGLLSNAIDYTDRDGKIFIGISKKEEELLITVADNGLGINPEENARLFSRFYRSPRAKNKKSYGTGLDLYLIKTLVERSCGSIDVISPSPLFEKGTTFKIKLPIPEA